MMPKPVTRRSFSRRSFFRGLGHAALVAGPLRQAHAARQPKVIIFYVGGGLQGKYWQQPLANGTALSTSTLDKGLDVFELPEFAALKAQMTIFDNLQFRWGYQGTTQVAAHSEGALRSLVAARDPAGRVSLDRVLAGRLRASTLFPSVRLKVIKGRYDHGTTSTGGSNSLSTTYGSPATAYANLFGAGNAAPATSSAPAVTASDARFRSDLLGQQVDECKAVVNETQRQLGAEAARRVMDHCDSLAEMRRRVDALANPPAAPPACAPGAAPTPPVLGYDTLAATMDLHTRVAVNALACGRTNVLLYELWTDQPDEKALFLPGFESMAIHTNFFHQIATPAGQATLAAATLAYTRWLIRKYAELARAAAALGLLEDTIIIWATNEPNGSHSYTGLAPCFYVGKGGGAFVTDRFIKPSARIGINDVFTSLLHGVGAGDIPAFGDDNSGRSSYGVDPLMLV